MMKLIFHQTQKTMKEGNISAMLCQEEEANQMRDNDTKQQQQLLYGFVVRSQIQCYW